MPDERSQQDLAAIRVIHERYERDYAAYVASLAARVKWPGSRRAR